VKARAIAIMLGTLQLLACSKHGQQDAAGNATSPTNTPNSVPGAAPWSGHVLRGDDTESLRSYLRTVQEVKAKVFEVQWNPATVAIDREAAIRSLRRVSRDGVTFVFSADEPAVRNLKPGSIMWVRDLALRKVSAVDTQGGLTTVRTGVVSLNEAMPNAHIEFEAPVPVKNFLLSHREFLATAANPPASSIRHRSYEFVPALYTVPPPGSTPGSGSAPNAGTQPGSGAPNSGSTPGTGAPNAGNTPGTPSGGAPTTGSSPGGGAPNAGNSPGIPGGGAPNAGSTPGSGAPNAGNAPGAPGAGAPNSGNAPGTPGSGAPNAGNSPGSGAPNAGSTPGGSGPNAGNAPGGEPSGGNPSGGGAPNGGAAPGGGGSPGGGAPQSGDAPGSGGDPEDQKDEESFGDNVYSGSLNGMQYAIGYKPLSSGAVGVTLESRDGEDGGDSGGEGGGKVFKHLFDISSDNVDVRFKVQAELNGFSAAGAYQIVGGNLEAAKLQFKNLNGHVTAAFVGRLGQPGNKGLKIPIMHLPISFNVPLPIEGIPFVVQLGGDFLLTVFLAGNHATLSVNGAYDFSGESGFSYAKTSGSISDANSFSGAQPQVTNYQGSSLGVSAVVLGAQLPRIGFGLSVTGAASTVAFFDVVHVLTMTQAADAGAMMLTPRCKRITYNAIGHVGVETQVLLLPIPVVQQWASDKLSGKKEVFNQSKEILDPPVKGCEIK